MPDKAFLSWLHREIPLTAAMQIDQLSFDGKRLSLHAPLAANINDKGTGFAGSTSGLATLSGWCIITLWLRQSGIEADVMIARSEIDYLAPELADLQSFVELPSDQVMDEFKSKLLQKGRARLPLSVRLGPQESPRLVLSGDYAARLRPTLNAK